MWAAPCGAHPFKRGGLVAPLAEKRQELTTRQHGKSADPQDAGLQVEAKPTTTEKLAKDLGVSNDTVQRSFTGVSQRAAAARVENTTAPKQSAIAGGDEIADVTIASGRAAIGPPRTEAQLSNHMHPMWSVKSTVNVRRVRAFP
jgi:hypothetical protein